MPSRRWRPRTRTSPKRPCPPLSLIDVEYDVLPPVLDVLDAMKDDAPVFHERLASMSTPTIRAGGLRSEDDTEKGSNVANHILFELGDPEQGFREAAVVVEREFRTVPVHQGYIEPHSATALWGPDGALTIWCSSQGHFQIRQHTATILGIPLSRIRVIPIEIGGGFGGKLVPLLEPVASLLSGKTGHPVKMTMSRSEVFEASGPTSGAYLKVKMGATNEGRITAADAYMVYEAGAFPGSPVPGAANCIFGPYDIPNSRIEGFDVVLNRPKTAAYRAPGAPSAAFATETVVDEICQVLGMDPLSFRIVNAAREGTWRAPPDRGSLAPAAWRRSGPLRSTRTTLPRWKDRTVAGVWPRASGPTTPASPAPPPASTPTAPSAWWRARPISGAAGPRPPCTSPRCWGDSRRGRQARNRRYGLGGLHLDHRRERRGLQDGLGLLRGRSGRPQPDDTAGSPGLGCPRR